MTGGLAIRPVREEDLGAIVGVHRAAFHGAAITQLGDEAVRRYYAWQGNPVHQCLGLVALRNDAIVGFCFGGVFAGALSGFLRRNVWFLAGAVARHPMALRHPEFRERLWSGLRLLWRVTAGSGSARGAGVEAAKPAEPVRSYGILAIATHPDHEGTGVARALMAAAESDARARAFGRMHLSVHPTNVRAVRFYETLGWERVGGDRWKGEMRRQLGADRDSGHPSVA